MKVTIGKKIQLLTNPKVQPDFPQILKYLKNHKENSINQLKENLGLAKLH